MNLTVGEIAAACGGKLVLCENDSKKNGKIRNDKIENDKRENGRSGNEINDTNVTSVVLDSRKVTEGGVFIATPGERVDGHSFVSSSFAQGVALAVVSKTPEQLAEETGAPVTGWGSYVLVEDTLQALKDIAEYYREKLDIKIVGITGSSGKTSTKEFVAGVLAEKYNVLKTEGNFNNEVGVPLTLLRIRPEHQVAVVEMGISDFGEMHRLSKMAKPDICVMTNIGQSHLDNLKTRDGILKAKSEIFDFMAKDGEICLNGEDDKLIPLTEIKGRKPHFFGLGGNPCQEVFASDVVSRGLWGSDARIRRGEAEFQVHVPLPGIHMVLNAAAATCVAGILGLTAEQIAAGIEKITPVNGRNNLIRLPGYTLIDDCYNANPASMRAALDLLALADTEKVAILGDMFGLGEENNVELHEQVGAYATEKGIDRILCVGERSKHLFQAACDHAEETRQITHFPTTEALLTVLEKEREEYVPDGCTVLVKASHAMEFERVVEHFLSVSRPEPV